MNTKNTKEFIRSLKETVKETSYVVRPYCGRGSYDKNCVSVDVDSLRDIWKFALMLPDADVIPIPEVDRIGSGFIIYWSKIEWPKEDLPTIKFDEKG